MGRIRQVAWLQPRDMGEPCMNTKIQIYLGKERKGKKKENQRKKEKKRGPCTLRKGENFRKKGVCELWRWGRDQFMASGNPSATYSGDSNL